LMKPNDKVCHRITIKTEKERELFKKREEKPVEGTPKIILGKAEPNVQEVWTDELKAEPIARLKEANGSDRGHYYARTVVSGCCGLSQHYGYFMINENMVFLNGQREMFVWINPDVRENHVKIYLPHTHEGELAMIKSIVNYLKMWFKCDYSQLADVKHLPELAFKVDNLKIKPN
jgi:hypothetical protein